MAAFSPPPFFTGPLQRVVLPSTHPGEARPPVSSWSWRRRDPGVGRPLLNPCHRRCWRSCKSHKWRQNNTGRTGFGQMSYRRDNPAETNIGKFHIFGYSVQGFVSRCGKPQFLAFSCRGGWSRLCVSHGEYVQDHTNPL